MGNLTTTTYAILGLLSRRPWSAYDLTQHMVRSAVRAVWPRTESRIYLEFKTLLDHKLATAHQEANGGRKRSVYTITAKGRTALKEWLQRAEGGFRVESEPLLKLHYSDLSPNSLEAQLAHIRTCLREEIDLALAAISSVIEDGFTFDENAMQNALLVQQVTNIVTARRDWLFFAEDQLKQMRKMRSAKQSVTQAKALYQQNAEALQALRETLD